MTIFHDEKAPGSHELVTFKITFCSQQSRYEVVCSKTYVGHADTVEAAKTVARTWLAQVLAPA